MAVVDPQDHAIVLSIVYDGPPEAGKTTSIRALATSFGREVITPEEHDGRTAYYDWLSHTGGRFQGSAIKCEIATVPAQRRWVRRRAHFLDRADVVIFVGDTRAQAWDATLERLRDLRARLDGRSGPTVGVVFQANRRDDESALPLAVVLDAVADERIAVVESIAQDGVGVRETFVFAVRLALDRVRVEQAEGRLPIGTSVLGDPDEVLGLLRGLALEPEGDDGAPRATARAAAPTTPRPPSPAVPSGLVWPPVDGRVVLGMVAATGAVLADGDDWCAELAHGWRAHSWQTQIHDDLDTGRAALIAWARLHVGAQALLSSQRCLVLAETGDGRWRLWQLVRAEPSLRERADVDVARVLTEALQLNEQLGARLPCALDSVGIDASGRAVFVGLVPPPGGAP